jgi:hypothetical protein
MSLEGASLRDLHGAREAHDADRIVIVIRDSANLAASLRATFERHFPRESILGPAMSSLLSANRDYLREATGRTKLLGDLSHKVVFISYNRWQSEIEYRRQIASALGYGLSDESLGTVTTLGPRSAFQPGETSADKLESLSRWRSTLDHQAIWVACRDSETMQMEREFHGGTAPLSQIEDAFNDFPVTAGDHSTIV